jgi:ethanolamine utilization protein EutP (predicted NTPase)
MRFVSKERIYNALHILWCSIRMAVVYHEVRKRLQLIAMLNKIQGKKTISRNTI